MCRLGDLKATVENGQQSLEGPETKRTPNTDGCWALEGTTGVLGDGTRVVGCPEGRFSHVEREQQIQQVWVVVSDIAMFYSFTWDD